MVEIGRMADDLESETVPGLKVKISPSSEQRCERCWIHDPTVGHDGSHPTICRRCAQALVEMEKYRD
jgi:isoleucyl-tRNA synthetase